MILETSTMQAMEKTNIARRKLLRLAKELISKKVKGKQKTDKKMETQP